MHCRAAQFRRKNLAVNFSDHLKMKAKIVNKISNNTITITIVICVDGHFSLHNGKMMGACCPVRHKLRLVA